MPHLDPKPDFFVRGQPPPGAADLNMLARAIVRQVRGGGESQVGYYGDRMVVSSEHRGPVLPDSTNYTAQMVVLQEHDDLLLCTPWRPPVKVDRSNWLPQIYDPSLGQGNITRVWIAKPYILQRTPWDGNSATLEGVPTHYDYANLPVGQRHANGVLEKITEEYVAGDIILAVLAVTGYSVPDKDNISVVWTDANTAGRHWLAESSGGVDPGSTVSYTDNTFNYHNSQTNYFDSLITYDPLTNITYQGGVVYFSPSTTTEYNIQGGANLTIMGAGSVTISVTTWAFTSDTVNYTSVTSTINNWAVTFVSNDSTWTINTGIIWTLTGAGTYDIFVANFNILGAGTVTVTITNFNFTGTVTIANNWSINFKIANSTWSVDTGIVWTIGGAGLFVLNVAVQNCWTWYWCYTNMTGGEPDAPTKPLGFITSGGGPLTGIVPIDPSKMQFFVLFNNGLSQLQVNPLAGSIANRNIALPSGATEYLPPGVGGFVVYNPSSSWWEMWGTTPCNVAGDFEVFNGTNFKAMPVAGAATGDVLTYDPTKALKMKWAAPAGGGGAGLTVYKCTVTFGNLAVAANTLTLVLKALAAGDWLIGVKYNISVAFSGGGLTPNFTVGWSGGSGLTPTNTSGYISSTILNPATNPPFTVSDSTWTSNGCQNQGAGWNVTFTATAMGNLNGLTAGSIDIWLVVASAA